jgi:hypothetical protein
MALNFHGLSGHPASIERDGELAGHLARKVRQSAGLQQLVLAPPEYYDNYRICNVNQTAYERSVHPWCSKP